MHRAHKIRLSPTNIQTTKLSKTVGCSRFAYNWALNRWNEQYKLWKTNPDLPKPSQYSLRRELNAIKRDEFPWMLESTKCAPQEAIITLGVSFANFFAHRAKYPKFRRKGSHDSFKLSSGTFRIKDKRIYIPHVGWVRMREHLRFEDAKILSATISRTATAWFVSVACVLPDVTTTSGNNGVVTGVDVGVRDFVLSTGEKIRVPRAYRKAKNQLRRASKSLSRKQKGSHNREKAKLKIARMHARIANIRNDWLHKTTTKICQEAHTVVIEDLNVKGMSKNHRLSTSILDASFGEFRRQIGYKASKAIIADRWYPSSQICHSCGDRGGKKPLNIRKWTCPSCGERHDRDVNAAINLKNLAVSSTVTACGEFLPLADVGICVSESTSAKQELDTKCT